MLKRFLNGLVELLAPLRCAACDAPLGERGGPFCAGCTPLVERAACATQAALRAPFRYGGPLADAVRRLKYEGRSEIARALSAELVACASPWLGQLDCVTAVPLWPAKLRARGYNQSGLLAREVGRGLSLPFRPHWLRRTRAGARQVGRSRAQRLQQIRGAFAASPRVAGRSVLLVDDVRTTGATLDEATCALQAAGARAVYGLVLALADDDPPHV